MRERTSLSSPESPDARGDPPPFLGGGVLDIDLDLLRPRDPDLLWDLDLLRDLEGVPHEREDPDEVEPERDLDVLGEDESSPSP